MSWGNKLVVVFILFALFIGTMVYKAYNTHFDLVSKDYYKEELRYQDKIDGMNNAAKLRDVRISESASAITIYLPKGQNGDSLKGEAFFYCITDEQNDKKFPLLVDSSAILVVPKSTLKKGPYQLKLNWVKGKETYYNEQKLAIQ